LADQLPQQQQQPTTTVGRDTSTIRDLTIRLRALDDTFNDRWDSLDELLDNKIEVLASAIAAKIGSGTTLPSRTTGPTTDLVTHQPVLPTMNQNGIPPPSLTSLWNWVDKSMLATILALEFDATDLHKLTPPEDVSLFDLNLNASAHGGILIHNGQVTSVTNTTKLDKSLPTYYHWLSAFTVYASIRTTFDVTGTVGPALFMFMREINHYQMNFDWKQVLRYFHECFRDFQREPMSVWLQPHVKAYTKFLHHNHAPIPTGSGTNQASSPAKAANGYLSGNSLTSKKKWTPEERATQVCQAYNLEDKGCQTPCLTGRNHVCMMKGCGKPHPLFEHK